jgi:signal transduction histidine kinase
VPSEIAPLVHAVNRALDRLEAGFRAQREFTADMAHELRTPLAVARARVDSLEPGPLRDQLRADLVNMTRTVNQVLDIAELENFLVGTESRADLHDVCADAVAFMAPLAVERGQTIALTGAAGPVWVHGHTEALFRAVRNLIENAIRASSERGSVEVTVEQRDGVAEIAVTDRGPGVPPDQLGRILEPYFSTHASGTGLGLPIAARIAEEHGGALLARNRPIGGFEVVVTIPLS